MMTLLEEVREMQAQIISGPGRDFYKRLGDQLESLQADKRRLDWLDSQVRGLHIRAHWDVHAVRPDITTIREAIDAFL